MLQSDVVVPGYYWLKHTSGFILMNVTGSRTLARAKRHTIHYLGINTKTGRSIEVKSAAKFRRAATPNEVQRFSS